MGRPDFWRKRRPGSGHGASLPKFGLGGSYRVLLGAAHRVHVGRRFGVGSEGPKAVPSREGARDFSPNEALAVGNALKGAVLKGGSANATG